MHDYDLSQNEHNVNPNGQKKSFDY